MMTLNEQYRFVNATILGAVHGSPGITLMEIERLIRPICRSRSAGYNSSRGYFGGRVDRIMKRGLLVKLLVCGRNHYYLPTHFPDGCDLRDHIDRLMAADVMEERGDSNAAAHLRMVRKVTVGRPPAATLEEYALRQAEEQAKDG